MEEQNVILGRNPVIEAIKSGKEIEKIYVSKTAGGNISKIINLAKEAGIVVSTTDNDILSKLAGSQNHQGVVAVGAVYKYFDVDDLLEYAEQRKEKPFLLILDEITDPHNLGAIIRSAEAFGVHGIIIPKRRAVGVNATVVKTSAGAVEHMRIAKVSNINNTIRGLKERGLWIVGTDVNAGKSFEELDYDFPLAIVIGSEGKGVSKLVLQNCDFVVKIPMKGKINSLNASVAASILIYQVVSKRKGKA
ncbi:23S rRNA (guanosine2251-2'-O)-methyltransferase [Thermoanaerobacter thermohydrosulfuricus]|uniref:rRNA methylase, putative, group 3 n=3 Tax=Thermoanaerobacter TaxID=1754 RepID=I8R314_9THEO|nr:MULTISPECIES: 23S rRNA (guanosine(2251)-2'-O)-methyltransferase RlmB [Thermoanaerobacter]HHY79880.1 23S rRNA (guanosine(2251)-2'-O)-methyltransferase RlmB [Thermoanaerobacter sp.]EIV99789.1 rRNA methylase, putative, group 3 [Thermoanaerobacter siderophilus SR4]EMT38030.1 rRNA methylase, putative, group 3 [Thermoanaerobacter thermohydrosulfuricus WC1]SDG40815.1 23S rRNA (guanosine2251-2'-O)-methyltransferase [Thermoanaerobacter thermohydrosulfuricus]SFE66641.1 23S rRNA (guanosine2251-2'-O)-m